MSRHTRYGPWPGGLRAVTTVLKPLTPAVSGISLSLTREIWNPISNH